MNRTVLHAALSALKEELCVDIANTPETVEESYRLRHHVYCLERGYETGENGLETDEFDVHARHVVLRLAAEGTAIGTARLILPREGQKQASFPMQQVCARNHMATLPFARTAEVSRFSLCKERGNLSLQASSLSRLMLVRGLVMLSVQEGVHYWCAAMERTLLRLLRASSIHFTPMGEPVEYHGLRQPAFCHLGAMLARMRAEQPAIWELITDGGRAFGPAMVERRAA